VSRKSPYVQTSHRVSGMMLANNTCIRHLFKSCLSHYDKLMRRKAFLDQYEKYDMFRENFTEFDDSKEVLESLINEYEKCQEKQS
jgi:tubulin gamma